MDLTIDKLEVDESLDADSTNPVQNKTVAAKFQEVEAGTVFGMSAEVSDDESSVRLALTNKSGAEIASVTSRPAAVAAVSPPPPRSCCLPRPTRKP